MYAKSPNQDQINERKNIDLTHEYLENIFHNYFYIQIDILMEELHPKPKLSMFCVLSQNHQHYLKSNTSILKQIV